MRIGSLIWHCIHRIIDQPVNIKLTKTSDLITPSLKRRLAAVKDKKPYLKAMGLAVVEIARRSFTEPGLRPDPWPKRKDNKPHNLLLETGTLRASLRLLSVSEDVARVGSDRPYAAIHQLGGKTKPIPARPFFPFDSGGSATPKARDAVRRALEARLAARMKGG